MKTEAQVQKLADLLYLKKFAPDLLARLLRTPKRVGTGSIVIVNEETGEVTGYSFNFTNVVKCELGYNYRVYSFIGKFKIHSYE